MTDENAIVNAFVTAIKDSLQSSLKLKTVEAYEGTLADAIKRLVRYPSILVLLENVVYSNADESGVLLEGDPTVALLIGNRSLQSKDQARKGAYDIMKSCRQLLHNTDVGITETTWDIKDQRLVDTSANINIFVQRYRGLNVFFS